MSKVYVVQNQHRWNQFKNEFEPKFDLSPAEPFGQIEYLLSPTAAPFNSNSIIEELQEKLENFSSDDYLLLVGNPVLIGFAVAIAAYHNKGKIALLQWSGKEHKYIKVNADNLFTF